MSGQKARVRHRCHLEVADDRSRHKGQPSGKSRNISGAELSRRSYAEDAKLVRVSEANGSEVKRYATPQNAKGREKGLKMAVEEDAHVKITLQPKHGPHCET